jgi:UDP-hydrolysing UDP-N-acetyl-D-glucosamine 2-epimerase
MVKKKICFVIASRANYGRIKPVLFELKKKINLQIILTASSLLDRFGNLTEILIKDGFKINKKCHVMIEGGDNLGMAKSTGLSILDLSNAFDELKPDVVVTVGDRFETLATAISASYMNITLAHIQGGEVTGSIDESVRHAITKLSHIHFAATDRSKKYIIKMGEDPKFVFNTGCPSIDIVKNNKKKLKDIKSLMNGVGQKFNFDKPYLTVIFHPVTTEFDVIKNQINILADAINEINLQVIWFWPNIDAGTDIISKVLRTFREKNKLKNVTFYKNFDVEDYITILKNTKCAVGNSSSFIREGSYLGTPSIIVGKRQNKREIGHNVIFSNFNKKNIIKKINNFIKGKKKITRNTIYGNGNASKKIAKLILNKKPSIQKTLKY